VSCAEQLARTVSLCNNGHVAAAANRCPLVPAPYVIRRKIHPRRHLLVMNFVSSNRACSALPPPGAGVRLLLPGFLLRHLEHPQNNFSSTSEKKREGGEQTLAGRIPPRAALPSRDSRAGAGAGGCVALPIAGDRVVSRRWRVGAGAAAIPGSTGPDHRWRRRRGLAGWPRANVLSAGPGRRGASGPGGRPPETAATATADGSARGWRCSGGSSTGSRRIGSSRSPTASTVR
jgi:hypothetical protein